MIAFDLAYYAWIGAVIASGQARWELVPGKPEVWTFDVWWVEL